ncbi:MAG: VanZ family protein [Marinoscillum sp.]
MTEPTKLLPSLLFFIFLCLIIYMADVDQKNWLMRLPKIIPFGDKVGHFTLYGLMAYLLNFTLSQRNITIRNYGIPLGSLVVLGFAIAEEFTQLAFESRTFDLVDLLFDVLGIYTFSKIQQYILKFPDH